MEKLCAWVELLMVLRVELRMVLRVELWAELCVELRLIYIIVVDNDRWHFWKKGINKNY